MKIKTLLSLALYVFIIDLLIPQTAYAYIDPGLGSMLLQGLAAGAISLLVFWRGLRRKIITFFKKSDDDKSQS